jgi:hypothetical protein
MMYGNSNTEILMVGMFLPDASQPVSQADSDNGNWLTPSGAECVQMSYKTMDS